MQLARPHRHRRVLALLISGLAPLVTPLDAAESRTQMAPFKVEAEFGVDGLRIQNSNSVLNQFLLDQHNVTQLQDITGIAPNLFTSNSDSRGFGDVIGIRGSANTIFFSGPAVAMYVDDVPSNSVSSYPSALLNIDSLTVKSGPQGTDYGRNAAAGVIDIKSRAPGAKHQGVLQVDRGSFNTFGLQGAFDGPISNELGYSLSVGYNEHEGYIHNAFRNRSADDRKAYAGRGALVWKPDPTLQLRFGLLAEKIEDDAPRLSSLFSPDRFTVSSDANGKTDIDRMQFSFQARKTLAAGTLIATTSRQEFDLDPSITDLDLSPLPLAFSRVVQSDDVWTQEIRFESKPAADRSQWRAGLFFSDSDMRGDAQREFAVPPSQFVPPGFVQLERTNFKIGQTSYAAYGSYDHPLAVGTTLKLGARAEHVDAEIKRQKTSDNNFRFPTPPEPRLSRSRGSDYLSLSAGIVHAISDALSVQARSSLAHKPEGFSGFTGVPALAQYDNERMWANEIGLTFGPPKGRFGGSILGFWNVIDDYQFERTVPNSTDFVVVNADEVRSRGIEGKFMFNPIEHVWWDFQAGYTDATFEKHRDASGARIDGKRVPFIPRYTLRTGVSVDLGQGFSANASYAAVGRSYYDERNTRLFSQKAYGIVNAQLRYHFDRWMVTVYGQNLFDEEYYQFINAEIAAGSPGAPRRWGVQLSYAY